MAPASRKGLSLRPLDLASAVAVAVIWGLGLTFAKAALDQFPPILLTALRFSLTALVLVWFVPIPRGQLAGIALVALVGATIQYALTFTGLAGLDASTAVLTLQLEVPFLALLGALFLGERIGWRRILGMVFAFLGVALIAGEPRLAGQLGALGLVLGGALAWSVGQVMIARLGTVGGFRLVAWVAAFAAPQLFVASFLFEEGQWQAIMRADALGWGVIVYLGLVMTAVGYGLWYRLLGRYEVNQVGPFLLLLPVTTVASGVALLGETLTPVMVLGGLLVLGGVGVIITARQRAAVARVVEAPDPAKPGP